MIKYIRILIILLFVGCSQQPEAQPQSPAPPKQTGLTQEQIKKLATDFKTEWLKQNPPEAQLMDSSTIREVKSTSTGWHVIFEQVTLPGEPEGESHHFLNIYIDSKGKLEKIVRGPDEIT